MYVARILYPVEVLGPGKRIGIWFCGCPRRCQGCSNPELWEFHERYKTTPEILYKMIKDIADNNAVDGFTITGGDPMYQADELKVLINYIRPVSNDILVYTGYKINELDPKYLKGISVLIDGEYIESRNNNVILRGSDNQEIHILDESLNDKYELYCKNEENKIQNFSTKDGIISVGIHKPNFIKELNQNMIKRGITNE
ncbi:MAG: radical SAM protein [Erysipelotrichaceae bacterium]|nr:radical SAM protein [Erysipelotrichaceae bacterium]